MTDDFSLFDTPVDRAGSGSLKWARYAGRDVLPMWVADMDFRSAPPILEALHRRVEHGVFGYSVAHEGPAAAVCGHLRRVHGVEVEPSWIYWMPGMVVGLAQAATLAGEEGDDIMTFTPVYPPFLKVHKDARRNLITVPLAVAEGRYTFDFAAMEAALTPRTRMIILCSPHNPVGRVWTRAELEELGAFCVKHDLLLISDEIHADLLLEPEISPHTTALKLEDIRNRTITLMAASKTYNVPGLGLCFAIIPDGDLRRRFQLTKNTFVAEISPFSFHATEAAFNECEGWRQSLCRYLRRNRDTIVQFMAEQAPAVKVPHIQATYLAWLDVRECGLPQPAAAHFEAHGLAMNNGADFGAPGAGFVRMNFGCPLSTLQEGLRRFKAALP